MSIAHTSTSHQDFLDSVEVPPGYGRIGMLVEIHEMTLESAGSEQTESDVGGTGEVLESFGCTKLLTRGTILEEIDDHLSVLQRLDAREVGTADDASIQEDWGQGFHSETPHALGLILRKIEPRLPRLSIISRSLQNPCARLGTVRHLNPHVGHMELLLEIDRDVHLIVLHSSAQRRSLPPGSPSVDHVLGRVSIRWTACVAVTATVSSHGEGLAGRSQLLERVVSRARVLVLIGVDIIRRILSRSGNSTVGFSNGLSIDFSTGGGRFDRFSSRDRHLTGSEHLDIREDLRPCV